MFQTNVFFAVVLILNLCFPISLTSILSFIKSFDKRFDEFLKSYRAEKFLKNDPTSNWVLVVRKWQTLFSEM